MPISPGVKAEPQPVLPEVRIACAFDDAYAPHFATLAASLAATRGTETLQITLIVGPGLTSGVIQKLERYLAFLGIALELISVPDATSKVLPPSAAYPPLIWYRLLLPELLPMCSKILYIDTDTLVLQSLLPLFLVDLGTKIIGAIASPTTGWEGHMEKIGVNPRQGYFNSGVLLMN
ncbi:MAG: glycosyltransferase family 8 protein, partial [Stenotrophobium sp.]